MALLTGTLTAHAQGTKSFGIIGGVDFSTFTGSDADGGTLDLGGGFTWSADKGSLTGFIGGLYMTVPIGASVVFEPELLYASKGAKYSSSASDGVNTVSGDLTYHADYIAVPLLLRYNFSSGKGPYVLGGFSVNFNVSCSADLSGSLATAVESGSAPSSADCALFNPLFSDPSEAWVPINAKTTFGGVLGLGYGKGKFGLEGRYDFDFTDAAEYDFSGAPSLNIKNSAWEVLVRYQFK